MSEEQKLEFIGSVFCVQYQCKASFYVEPPNSGEPRPGTGTGVKHLVVLYGDGYTGRDDRPIVVGGQREFSIGIPDDWSEEKLLAFLLHPKSPETPFPAWEVSTRAYGLTMLKEF